MKRRFLITEILLYTDMLAPSMIPRMKQTFHEDVLSGKVEWLIFFNSIKEEPADQVIER